jgi:hypothetical protein
MIVPTVGRVVWFWPGVNFVMHRAATGQNFAFDGNGPCAAIVVKVWGDRLVNLSVFDQNGTSHAVTSCPLKQEGDEIVAEGSYCEWMPYQIGQAKKEAPESKPQTFVDRLIIERDELVGRITKLDAFTVSDQFKSLPDIAQKNLLSQRAAMGDYLAALLVRIEYHQGDQK